MPEPLVIVMAVFAVLGVVLLVAALVTLRKQRWLGTGMSLMLAIFFLALAALGLAACGLGQVGAEPRLDGLRLHADALQGKRSREDPVTNVMNQRGF